MLRRFKRSRIKKPLLIPIAKDQQSGALNLYFVMLAAASVVVILNRYSRISYPAEMIFQFSPFIFLTIIGVGVFIGFMYLIQRFFEGSA